MLKSGAGRILNVASTASFVPVPQLSVYAAAKAYVLSLTESIAEELRGTGVAATALCPGFTDTAMIRGSALAKSIPPAMIMLPKDVAELGCAACLKGEAICVPGLANKVLASGAPLMPRALVLAFGGAINGGGLSGIGRLLGRCGGDKR
jgi:short-subunit dehydrogenase